MSKYQTGLVVGAFIFAASIAAMGVVHFYAKKSRCPYDCRLVRRNSGTGCDRNTCFCPDMDDKCQPKNKTLTTAQRRLIRLLYSFVLIGLGLIIGFSCCVCCRAEGPATDRAPRDTFPSMDTQANFPNRGFKAYDYERVTEMSRL